MIKCELCGKEFVRLRKHLMHEHHITTRKYTAMFPNALIVDPAFAERMRKTRKESDINTLKENMIYKKGEKKGDL